MRMTLNCISSVTTGHDNYCPPTRVMYLRRGSLDGSQQVEAQHRQDQAFLGRFQERFRSAWEQGPPLQLGSEIIAASDHVCLLGVTVSSDLSLQMYVFSVCSSCFYTGSARFAESDDLLTLSRQRLLCTRSSRLVSTILQHCLGWFTEDRDGQAPVRPKCRSARRQPNEEVRPRPDTFTSHRVALAGRS